MAKRILLTGIQVLLVFIVHAQLQSVLVEAGQTKICEGDSTQLFLYLGIMGTPELEVTWSPDYNISSIHSDSPIVKPARSTQYKVTVYDTENKISITKEITISVVPRPIVVAPEPEFACSGSFYSLSPVKFDNSTKPVWEHNGQGYFESTPDDSLNVVYIPDENELGEIRFIITGHGIDYCEDVSDTTYVTYTSATTASITADTSFSCSNKSITFHGTVENQTGFVWRHNGKGDLTDTNTLDPTYIPANEESGTINIFLEAIGEVCNYIDTFNLEISPIFAQYNYEVEACAEDRVVLSVSSSPYYTYNWSTSENKSQIIVEPETSNVYTVEVTNNKGCTTQVAIYVEVTEKPVVALSGDPETHTVTAYPGNLSLYEFYDENDNLLYSGKSPVFNYSNIVATLERIYVIATGENGCKSDKESALGSNNYLITEIKKVNAFSPNGDGINDLLMHGRRTTVFDRSGKILYDGWDGWDGTFNGREMPQGTYFYILYNEEEIYYKGPVTIIRK